MKKLILFALLILFSCAEIKQEQNHTCDFDVVIQLNNEEIVTTACNVHLSKNMMIIDLYCYNGGIKLKESYSSNTPIIASVTKKYN